MTYTVTAERGPSGVWVLQCVQFPGAISQSRSLSSAPELMREAIAFVAEVDPSEVGIDLVPVLPEGMAEDIARAREAVARLAEQQQVTAALSRATVKRLADHSFTGQDIAALLGISSQRVSQLARS